MLGLYTLRDTKSAFLKWVKFAPVILFTSLLHFKKKYLFAILVA